MGNKHSASFVNKGTLKVTNSNGLKGIVINGSKASFESQMGSKLKVTQNTAGIIAKDKATLSLAANYSFDIKSAATTNPTYPKDIEIF